QDEGVGGAGRGRRRLSHRSGPPSPGGPDRDQVRRRFSIARGFAMGVLVYFSSVSENTHRFVQRLGLEAHRIPLRPTDPFLRVEEEYVLIVPTYGFGNGRGAVPKQVIKFLNDPHIRSLCRGVIAAGNTNFGQGY